MKTKVLVISILFAIVASTAFADFDIRKWDFYKEVKINNQINKDYCIIKLDKDIAASRMNGFIRLIDSKGEEIPFADASMLNSSESITKTSILNSSSKPGVYYTATVDFGSRLPRSNVSLVVNQQNFTCRVKTEGSNNNSNFLNLTSDAYIFDFTRGNISSKSTSINLPENDYRYLRFTVYADKGKLISITGVEISHPDKLNLGNLNIYDGKPEITQNKKKNATVLEIPYNDQVIPDSKMEIISSSDSYKRFVQVEAIYQNNEIANLGDGSIFKIKTSSFSFNESTIACGSASNIFEYPKNNRDFEKPKLIPIKSIRITIFNEDNKPIQISKVRIYTPQTAVIVRKADFGSVSGIKLYYGNTSNKMPSYDITDILQYVKKDNIMLEGISLSKQMRNLYYKPEVKTQPWLNSNQWILWVAIFGAIGIMIVYILKLAKKMSAKV